MKCVVEDLTLTVPIIGDGGYNNRSRLVLDLVGIGMVDVDDPWDLTKISDRELKSFQLSIPSGTLRSRYGVRMTVEGSDLLLQADCRWNGIQAGLFGGMSGYGTFEFLNIENVQGTFLLPKDGIGQMAGEPVDFETHHADWTEYSLRMAAMRSEATGLGWDKTHEMAVLASEALKIPRWERTQAQCKLLENWWKLISDAVECYVPEVA